MKRQLVTRLSVRALLGAAAPALLALAGMTAGCAQNSIDLRLTSLEKEATFVQRFSKAYVSTGGTAAGGTEVVLIDEQAVGDARHGAALAAASDDASPELSAAAVRQVMHVKVLWRPQRGTKQSHPSYTNAGLRWYVIGDGGRDVLEYSGAGFVALAETPAGTQVTIKNATLKPVGVARGALTDPVGPARVTGTFIARKSPKRVDALLAEVKSTVNGASMSQAAAQ